MDLLKDVDVQLDILDAGMAIELVQCWSECLAGVQSLVS